MNALSLVLVITVLWDVERISVYSALKVALGLLRPMYVKVKPVNDVVVPGIDSAQASLILEERGPQSSSVVLNVPNTVTVYCSSSCCHDPQR